MAVSWGGFAGPFLDLESEECRCAERGGLGVGGDGSRGRRLIGVCVEPFLLVTGGDLRTVDRPATVLEFFFFSCVCVAVPPVC